MENITPTPETDVSVNHSRKFYVGVVISIVLIVVIGGVYFLYQKNKSAQEKQNQVNLTVTENTKVEPKEDTVKEESLAPQQAEKIVVKEAPITEKSKEIKINNTVVATSTKLSASSSDITTQEKEEIITAYFEFEKILDSYDPEMMLVYAKKVYPLHIAEIEKQYAEEEFTKDEYAEMVDLIKIFLGYDILTDPQKIRTLEQSRWVKESPNDIVVDVDMFVSAKFRKTNNVWYVHINNNF